MKLLSLLLTFGLLLLQPQNAFAKPTGLSAYAAVGNNYVPPGSIRVGWNDWEVGMLSRSSFGIAKMIFYSPSLYVGLGGGVMSTIKDVSPSLHAAIGFDWEFWSIFGLRGEWYSDACAAGIFQSTGLLGLELDF